MLYFKSCSVFVFLSEVHGYVRDRETELLTLVEVLDEESDDDDDIFLLLEELEKVCNISPESKRYHCRLMCWSIYLAIMITICLV